MMFKKKGILFLSCLQQYNQCSLDTWRMIIIQISVLYNHLYLLWVNFCGHLTIYKHHQ